MLAKRREKWYNTSIPKKRKKTVENTSLNIALLIDSDNISPKYVETIFDELKPIGTVTVKRIYGDWTLGQAKSWKSVLAEYAILPVQQYAYTSGKNSTDSAMIIDAMDVLYLHKVDVFCLASSDSDFTRLAARLRESGKRVIGMGESKTPKAFVSSCDSFRYLDVLSGEADSDVSASDNSITPLRDIEQEILSMLSQRETGAKVLISVVKDNLQRKYSDFDERNYGFSKFSSFLKSFDAFSVVSDSERYSLYICQAYSAQRAEIEAYVKEMLRNRGGKMNIGEVNTKLLERYRDFSVKALGYKQIKPFLADIDGVKIKNCDLILKK